MANTAAETSLIGATGVGSLLIPAGRLKVGTTIRMLMKGVLSTTGSPNATWKWKLGAAVGASSASSPGAGLANAPFEIEGIMTVRSIGPAGSVVISAFSEIAGSAVGSLTGRGVRSGVVPLDTTIDNAVAFTYQWGTANAGNTITCDQAWFYLTE